MIEKRRHVFVVSLSCPQSGRAERCRTGWRQHEVFPLVLRVVGRMDGDHQNAWQPCPRSAATLTDVNGIDEKSRPQLCVCVYGRRHLYHFWCARGGGSDAAPNSIGARCVLARTKDYCIHTHTHMGNSSKCPAERMHACECTQAT